MLVTELKEELSVRRKCDGPSRNSTPVGKSKERLQNGHSALPLEDVERLHSLANGDFNHHNHKADGSDGLADGGLASPSQSRTLIQSLLQKLTVGVA